MGTGDVGTEVCVGGNEEGLASDGSRPGTGRGQLAGVEHGAAATYLYLVGRRRPHGPWRQRCRRTEDSVTALVSLSTRAVDVRSWNAWGRAREKGQLGPAEQAPHWGSVKSELSSREYNAGVGHRWTLALPPRSLQVTR